VLFLLLLFSMLSKFLKHIKQSGLCCETDKILLTVSGGIDSMVMAELFLQGGYHVAIAHCNFALRGNESDHDELFVRNYAKRKKIKYFVKSFDTSAYAKQNKLSIQEAARKLRYSWFEALRKEIHYDYIATAHHADDQIESFFVNLIRGTSIRGLTGIPEKQNHVIRPLLPFFRNELEDYACKHKICFCSDSSNSEDKYLRNKIRLKLLPVLEKIQPEYRKTILECMCRLKNTETIYHHYLESNSPLFVSENGNITLPLEFLKTNTPCSHLLYEYISPYGFNKFVCEDICRTLNNISGKIFYSQTHRLIKDRDYLIIEQIKKPQEAETFLIEKQIKKISEPLVLHLKKIKNTNSEKTNKAKTTALLDYDKLLFPLSLRRWKKGDIFYPLGMKNKKKLSDFFSDNKFSIVEKSNTWILCSGNKIIWIVGHRIDNRFKITPSTHTILEIKWLK
jgi:tRNA(Ile)-lysidine synthase